MIPFCLSTLSTRTSLVSFLGLLHALSHSHDLAFRFMLSHAFNVLAVPGGHLHVAVSHSAVTSCISHQTSKRVCSWEDNPLVSAQSRSRHAYATPWRSFAIALHASCGHVSIAQGGGVRQPAHEVVVSKAWMAAATVVCEVMMRLNLARTVSADACTLMRTAKERTARARNFVAWAA
jgi:hypothetical protein